LTRASGRASKMPDSESLEAFAATGATLAIHLAIHALPAIVETLLPFYGADCPAAIVAHATHPNEKILRGTLDTLCAQLEADPIERTAMILVGPALAASDFRESALYDPDYRRHYRGGPA
jgi:precorrin-4/cobalt-precorrin-4 C11-methyltransferase